MNDDIRIGWRKVLFSKSQILVCLLFFNVLFSFSLLHAQVKLDVPLVRQHEGRLCAPASLEMVLRYWGIKSTSQQTIAKEIAQKFVGEKRFANSKYVKNGMRNVNEYPGTPAYILTRYLKNRGITDRIGFESIPRDPDAQRRTFEEVLRWTKLQVDNRIPVIVHQYWTNSKSTGHYRVVTGYDESKKIIFLNDPKLGEIVQSYDEYKVKGAVQQKWMPYYSIAFRPDTVIHAPK